VHQQSYRINACLIYEVEFVFLRLLALLLEFVIISKNPISHQPYIMSGTQTVQIISICTALLASGGIAALSLFDVPMIQSQPASRSLPMIRWLFSRGSHTFPTAAITSASGFVYLAYTSLPSFSLNSTSLLLQHAAKGKPGLYLAASALSFSIAPITSFMIPTNFVLIRKNEELGGSRSAASADYRAKAGSKERSADESVDSKDDVSQWKDLSVPQEETERKSTKAEDKEVNDLLERFGQLNMLRAVAIGSGGIVGLLAALA
jgi:hypothetical protein